MQDFRNLKVWHKAHGLVLDVYRVTRGFPPEEKYGLQSQMRRAAASIPTNIAEGCGRSSDADFSRFLWIANSSASELDYLLLLSTDLGFVDGGDATSARAKLVETRRMLSSLIGTLSGSGA